MNFWILCTGFFFRVNMTPRKRFEIQVVLSAEVPQGLGLAPARLNCFLNNLRTPSFTEPLNP